MTVLRRLRGPATEAWLPALLIAAWWFGSASSSSPYFPPLSTIWQRFRQLWLFAKVPTDVVPSLANLGRGLLIAIVVGIVLGIALASLPLLNAIFDPYLQFMRAMPGLALLPLLVVLFGIGDTGKVIIIAGGAIWPVLLNTIDGVRGIDPALRTTARLYHVPRLTQLRLILLPGAAPLILVGVRTAVSIGVILMVGSELYAATHGIGYFVLSAQQTFATADMWAGIVLLGLLGYALNRLVAVIEHRVLSWQPPAQRS